MTARIQALYTGTVLFVSGALALVGFAWWEPAQSLAIGVAAAGAGVNAGIWVTHKLRKQTEFLRAGGVFGSASEVRAMVRRPPHYNLEIATVTDDEGTIDWYGNEVPPKREPIHWRLADHVPEPLIVTLSVDTERFDEGMRDVRAGVLGLSGCDAATFGAGMRTINEAIKREVERKRCTSRAPFARGMPQSQCDLDAGHDGEHMHRSQRVTETWTEPVQEQVRRLNKSDGFHDG